MSTKCNHNAITGMASLLHRLPTYTAYVLQCNGDCHTYRGIVTHRALARRTRSRPPRCRELGSLCITDACLPMPLNENCKYMMIFRMLAVSSHNFGYCLQPMPLHEGHSCRNADVLSKLSVSATVRGAESVSVHSRRSPSRVSRRGGRGARSLHPIAQDDRQRRASQQRA